MEDRSFKAYLMSDPQHTARGGALGPPVSLSGSLCLRTCSVCLSAFVPAGLMSYILSGTGLCAVSLTFCASLVVFPFHVEP